MVLALLSAGFQSLPPLPTIKLGPSGADSRVGGLVHALGPCGSLQQPLLWGWEFLLLLPQLLWVFSIRGLRLYFPEPWVSGLLRSPLFVPVYICTNVGQQSLAVTTLWGLLAAAWPAPLHNPPPLWVLQPPPCHESCAPRLPVSAPPTGLDECVFFISLVVGLPYSSIFSQFWLFFVFKLLSFFWLCEEAQCVYLASILAGRFPLHTLNCHQPEDVSHLSGSQWPFPLLPVRLSLFTCIMGQLGFFCELLIHFLCPIFFCCFLLNCFSFI